MKRVTINAKVRDLLVREGANAGLCRPVPGGFELELDDDLVDLVDARRDPSITDEVEARSQAILDSATTRGAQQ